MTMPDYQRLVNPRSGLIKSLQPIPIQPELPVAYKAFRADVSNTRAIGPWQADRTALGAAFYDEERARQSAIGEAMERYCGNFIPAARLRRASYQELCNAGEYALDPSELILYSEKQYSQRGFPFTRFTPDLRVLWCEGTELGSGRSILVPASIVYLNYFSDVRASEPPTNFTMFSGIAAGPSRAEAERSALEELIERDATMIWWQSGSQMADIDLSALPQVQAALFAPGNRGTISYTVQHIRTPFEIPVIAAWLHDHEHQLITLGFACRADPTEAILKALIEAIHLRGFHLGLLREDGDVWRAMRAGILNKRAYKPYRADRSYMDAFRRDFHDITDLGAQAQIYLDPRMHVHITPFLSGGTKVSLTDIPAVHEQDRRATYLQRLRRHGFSVISVDLTTPDVQMAGLHAVRVIVPGLYPNGPAAFPFLGGKRLYEEPATYGWLPAPLDEEKIIRIPMPHT